MPRWLPPFIAIVLGVALGLFYGWALNPVQFVDTTPASLRSDFRADYVLMVAETYHQDQNAQLAAQRLAIFGSDSPDSIASQALQIARSSGYASSDIALLQDLTRGLQAYLPSPATEGSPP